MKPFNLMENQEMTANGAGWRKTSYIANFKYWESGTKCIVVIVDGCRVDSGGVTVVTPTKMPFYEYEILN